ncbi:hypothetical protein Tco_0508431 [Tanacetum coccineum]
MGVLRAARLVKDKDLFQRYVWVLVMEGGDDGRGRMRKWCAFKLDWMMWFHKGFRCGRIKELGSLFLFKIRCEYTMPNFSTKDRMRKPKSDRRSTDIHSSSSPNNGGMCIYTPNGQDSNFSRLWRDVKVCSFDDAIYQTYVNLKADVNDRLPGVVLLARLLERLRVKDQRRLEEMAKATEAS